MTDVSSPSYPVSREALADFIEELRSDAGFDIGIGQHLAVQQLLLSLAATGQLPEQPRRLRTLLGPLLVSSPAQQADFGRRFDRWVARIEAWDAERKQSAVRREQQTTVAEELRELQRKSIAWPAAISGAVLVAMVVFGYFVIPWEAWTLPEIVQPGPGPQPKRGPVALDEPKGLSGTTWVVVSCLALPVTLIVLSRLWWQARARDFLTRHGSEGVPNVRFLTVRGLGGDLFERGSLLRAARWLRVHERLETNELDVPATVEQTARECGLFTPITAKRPQLPEYLALVDRRTYSDQQARLIETLLERLRDEGLFLDVYYFDGDPRVCRSAKTGEGGLGLDELIGRFSRHRLWLFTDGDGLINRFTGTCPRWLERFGVWASRTVFTLTPLENWGFREQALREAGFQVLPANESGLCASADPILGAALLKAPAGELPPLYPRSLLDNPRRWLSGEAPSADLIEQGLREVREYLSEAAYVWLAACGVYPDLRWELTLVLGHRLKTPTGDRFLRLEDLSALVRLPWFRAGYMPDWLRARLLNDLSLSQQREIRETLEQVLLSSLQGLGDRFELEIAEDERPTVQRLCREVLRRLRKDPAPRNPVRDRVFLTYMNSSLAVQLPRAVGRFLRGTLAKVRQERLSGLPPRTLPGAIGSSVFVVSLLLICTAFLLDENRYRGLVELRAPFVLGVLGLGPLLIYSGCISWSHAANPNRGARARLLFELLVLWTVVIVGGLTSEVASGTAVYPDRTLADWLGGAASCLALVFCGWLTYEWFRRQSRKTTPLADFLMTTGQVVDAWMPDRWLTRIVGTEGKVTERKPQSWQKVLSTSAILGLVVHFGFGLRDDALAVGATGRLTVACFAFGVYGLTLGMRLFANPPKWFWLRTFFDVTAGIVLPLGLIAYLCGTFEPSPYSPGASGAEVPIPWTVFCIWLTAQSTSVLPSIIRSWRPTAMEKTFVLQFARFLDRWLPDRFWDWLLMDGRDEAETLQVSRPVPMPVWLSSVGMASVGFASLGVLSLVRGAASEYVLSHGVIFSVLWVSSAIRVQVHSGNDRRLRLAAQLLGVSCPWFAAWFAPDTRVTGGISVSLWTLFPVIPIAIGGEMLAFIHQILPRSRQLLQRGYEWIDRWMPDRLFAPQPGAVSSNPPRSARRSWGLSLLVSAIVGLAIAWALQESGPSEENLIVFGGFVAYTAIAGLAEARNFVPLSRLKLLLEVTVAWEAFAVFLYVGPARDLGIFVLVTVFSQLYAMGGVLLFTIVDSFRRRRHPLHRWVFAPLEVFADWIMPDQMVLRLWRWLGPTRFRSLRRGRNNGRAANRGEMGG